MKYTKRLTFFILAFSIASWAEVAPQKIEQIKSSLKISKARIEGAELEQRKVLGTLYSINNKMKSMSKKREKLTRKVLKTRSKAKNTAKEIAMLDAKILTQRSMLSKRLGALYKLGDAGVMPILFSSTSSHDLDKTLKYLKILSDKDYRLIRSYENDMELLQANKAELKKQITKLVGLKKTLNSQELMLEKQQESKNKFLTRLKKQKKSEIQKLANLRKETNKIKNEIESEDMLKLLDNSFYERKGKLLAPVNGILLQDYGLVQNDVYRYQLRHKGHLYQCEKNEPVRAVHNGRVEYVGQVQGYDQTILVDHGDHFYTVYSHLSGVKVAKGDKVKTGDQIAYVGPIDPSKDVGLYFEVRHFSEAVDPNNWLLQKNKEMSQLERELHDF